MTTFICMYEDHAGESGASLLEAYNELKKSYGYDIQPDDCTFYEAVKVEVEYKIVKKEVVSKVTKKVPF